MESEDTALVRTMIAAKRIFREEGWIVIQSKTEREQFDRFVLDNTSFPAHLRSTFIAAPLETAASRWMLVKCVTEVRQSEVLDAYYQWLQFRQAENIAYSIVGTSRAPEVRDTEEYYADQFYVFNLSELSPALKSLSKSLKSKHRKPRRAQKSDTIIGRAIEANQESILVAIASLTLQIDRELERLRQERPNSNDSIVSVGAQISRYESMRAQLEVIRSVVTRFVQGEAKEKEAVKTVANFRESISNWWAQSHANICSTAASGGLFVGYVGLLHLMKADSGVALAIGGALIGGETAVKALKALPRKLFDVVHK